MDREKLKEIITELASMAIKPEEDKDLPLLLQQINKDYSVAVKKNIKPTKAAEFRTLTQILVGQRILLDFFDIATTVDNKENIAIFTEESIKPLAHLLGFALGMYEVYLDEERKTDG